MTALVEIEGLRVTRGSFDLRIDRLTLQPGEVYGLVGPNGSGKTTLLLTLHGLLKPDAGTVRVCGVEPWTHGVHVRSHVGYASPDVALFPLRTSKLYRTLAPYYPGRWDPALCDALVKRFEVPDQDVGSLSVGQGIRARLVAALAFKPDLALLDEPTGGLDLGHRLRLAEVVKETIADGTRSILVSSHQLTDVQRMATRLIVLDKGRVVHDDRIDALLPDGKSLEEAMIAWGVAG